MKVEWTEIQLGLIGKFKENLDFLIVYFGILLKRNSINGSILIQFHQLMLQVIEYMNHMLEWHMMVVVYFNIDLMQIKYYLVLKKQDIMLFN